MFSASVCFIKVMLTDIVWVNVQVLISCSFGFGKNINQAGAGNVLLYLN